MTGNRCASVNPERRLLFIRSESAIHVPPCNWPVSNAASASKMSYSTPTQRGARDVLSSFIGVALALRTGFALLVARPTNARRVVLPSPAFVPSACSPISQRRPDALRAARSHAGTQPPTTSSLLSTCAAPLGCISCKAGWSWALRSCVSARSSSFSGLAARDLYYFCRAVFFLPCLG